MGSNYHNFSSNNVQSSSLYYQPGAVVGSHNIHGMGALTNSGMQNNLFHLGSLSMMPPVAFKP